MANTEAYKGHKVGVKKATVRKQGVRGVFSATVYKPTVDGRVVGTQAAGYENAALTLAKKAVDRLG